MPVLMPAYGFAEIDVLPDLGVQSARSEGGLVITSRHTDPFWTGQLRTVQLEPWMGGGANRHADFLAFLSRCVDENLRVDWVHPRHVRPSAYTALTWPMVGDAELNDVTDARTIDVAGLTLGLILKRGDRLSILQDDIIVHRWIGANTVVSSTISQSLPVTPRLPIGVLAPSAIVVLEDPKMRFMIVPGSWDAREAKEPTAITFEISEALR